MIDWLTSLYSRFCENGILKYTSDVVTIIGTLEAVANIRKTDKNTRNILLKMTINLYYILMY